MTYLRHSERVDNPSAERELTQALQEVSREYGNNLRQFFTEIVKVQPKAIPESNLQIPEEAVSTAIGISRTA